MDHDPTTPNPASGKLSRRRMLFAGAGIATAAAVSGCGLTTSDGSSAGGGGSGGSGSLRRILKARRIRFGVDLSFRPLQYRDPKTKEPTGYAIEVSKLLAEALDVEPEWVEIPFQEMISAQAAGQFDMAGIPVVNSAERSRQVAFAGAPAFLEGTYLFRRPGAPIRSAADVNSKDVTIALLGGSAQINTAKLLFPKAKRKELPNDTSATSDVLTGRSDVLFIGDYSVADASKKKLELVQPRPVAVAWNTYFMPQGDIELNQFVTNFLHLKASDQTLAGLWQKFVAGDIEKYGVQTSPVVDPYLAAALAR